MSGNRFVSGTAMLAVFMVGILAALAPAQPQPPDTLWTRTFGGEQSDAAHSVQPTADGGFLIAAQTYSFGAGHRDLWLIKIDENGDSLWSRTFGGEFDDGANCLRRTADGGFIMAGWSKPSENEVSDVWLIKTDENGELQWSQTYGGERFDKAASVQPTADGGFIIAGETYSFGAGGKDAWLIKTDENGELQWSQTYGGQNDDGATWIQPTADGGFIIAGETYSFGARGRDAWLIKTDENGERQWSQTYGGEGSETALCLQLTADGGYIMTGSTTSFGAGNFDFWLIKTDENGEGQWSQTYGGRRADEAHSVQPTADGGYLIVGESFSFAELNISDIWLMRTDQSGDSLWSQTYGGERNERGFDIQPAADGGFIIAGETSSFGYGDIDRPDAWLIRLESEPEAVNDDAKPSLLKEFGLLPSYPNPFNSQTVVAYSLPAPTLVKLAISDLAGREVRLLVNRTLPAGGHTVTLDGQNLATGVYLLRLSTPLGNQSQKLMLIK